MTRRHLKQIVIVGAATLTLANAAQAHVNPTYEGYGAALRSCDRAYGGGPNTCDLYKGANAGPHSYKAFVFWRINGRICRAVILVSHRGIVIWRHKLFCGGRRP